MNKPHFTFLKPQKINNRVFTRLFFGVLFLSFAYACQKPPSNLIGQSEFSYLDTRFKLDYKKENEQSNAKVKLRMRRDSLIWASITGPVGIEGIRVQITQDSIYLIDRVNKQYIETDLDTLTRLLKFEIDYALMQSLILGDMPIPQYEPDQATIEGKLLKIIQEKEGIEITNFVNPKMGKLEKLHLLDLANGNRLEMDFLNYHKKQGNWFPQKGLIVVTYKDKETQQIQQTTVKIEHGKTVLGNKPVTFPFSVPSKYRE
jgi:hypothetical protein